MLGDTALFDFMLQRNNILIIELPYQLAILGYILTSLHAAELFLTTSQVRTYANTDLIIIFIHDTRKDKVCILGIIYNMPEAIAKNLSGQYIYRSIVVSYILWTTQTTQIDIITFFKQESMIVGEF